MIGFSEILVIIVVTLIFINPSKLAKIAFCIGKVLRIFNENKDDIVKELNAVASSVSEVTAPIKESMQPIMQAKEDIVGPIRDSIHPIIQAKNDIIHPMADIMQHNNKQ